MKKRSILFVMSSLRNGGAERSLVNLLQLFDYETYDVDLLLLQEEGMFLKQLPRQVHLLSAQEKIHILFETQKKKCWNFRHPYLSAVHLAGTAISQKREGKGSRSRQYRWTHFYRQVIEELPKHYDAAVAYMHCEPTYFVADKVRADRKIAWVHIDYSQIAQSREIDLKYFQKMDNVVTISDLCVGVLRKEFPSIADKFTMLPNLTSSQVVKALADEFYPPEYEEGTLKFVSVGRLNPQKGFDFALDAAAELKKRGLRFHWYVLGIGELRQILEEKRDRLNLQDCFEFIGARENPYTYMKNADIVVQSSRYEGKSVTLDEAKILGRPIVVTNYPTVCDQIDRNEGIITAMDGKSIADGIERMLRDKEKYISCLSKREYGNQKEIQNYYNLFE